jgi:hypothetical protein
MKFYKKQDNIQRHHGIEYKNIQSLRLLYILIIGSITLSIGLIISFIYSNVYQTLEEANNIIILRSELGVETIDFEKMEQVKNTWKTRQEKPLTTISRDPFSEALPPNIQIITEE